MDIRHISPFLSVSPQILETDLGPIASRGFKSIINNRPDNEEDGQPRSDALAAAAQRCGLAYCHIPVVSGKLTDADVTAFAQALAEMQGPALAFCRTGTRSTTLWALTQAQHLDVAAILDTAAAAGYNLAALRPRLEARAQASIAVASAGKADEAGRTPTHDIVIVGGGSAGLACAASLLKRRPSLDIVVVEPRNQHYYQPGWTLVGGGVFQPAQTERSMASVMPAGVAWVRAAVSGFEPEKNQLVLADGERLGYRVLVAAPGINLDWHRVEGLEETLGRNGVTSNYRFDLAPYTWELVQSLKGGRAIFTQPPMPIKCAGAPQKAMYLSASHWKRTGAIKNIEIEFFNAGAVLFGVKEYVPALMEYVKAYGAKLNFGHNLVAIDGPAHKAWFETRTEAGETKRVETTFDMIHVCPPQSAPAFIRESPLADAAGWIEVDHQTLQHPRYGNVFGLGDACSAPNAKTAAAARKQAPVAATNVLAALDGQDPRAVYDGYGSCPLTVEHGKIVLAEFAYGGKLTPSFPSWLNDGTKPTRLAWFLKEKILPFLYWHAMLKGREWLAEPTILPHRPTPHEAKDPCVPPAENARKS
jgi:sulfide:quinone oxidoreductase